MTIPHSDVLVLGGGVIGLTSALYLLKAGASVCVLEQGAPGSGSSHGNCGTITPSHAAPLAMPGMPLLALRSLLQAGAPLYLNPRMDSARLRWFLGFARRCNWADFYRAAEARSAILQRSRRLLHQLVQDESLQCEFSATGELYVYRTARALRVDEKSHVAVLERFGIEMQRLSGDETQSREPALRPGVHAGLFHPGDAQFRPDRFVAELARCVREHGGLIETATPIESFDTSERQIKAVRTSRGLFQADRILLALGAWSPLLGRQLGLRLPMQPGKGYSLTYTRPHRVPNSALLLREASVCVTSWEQGYRLGSTMEFSGYSPGLNRVRLQALRQGAAQGLLEPEGPQLLEEWWGWRPMSMDEVPIIGPSSRWANLHFATAHGMLGMSMAAATGELVTQLMAGDASTLDPTPYRPARFGL